MVWMVFAHPLSFTMNRELEFLATSKYDYAQSLVGIVVFVCLCSACPYGGQWRGRVTSYVTREPSVGNEMQDSIGLVLDCGQDAICNSATTLCLCRDLESGTITARFALD